MMAMKPPYTVKELKKRQKEGTLEKEIAEKNDWVLEICKANIWEGDNSIKCPKCKDNLSAGWHTRNWEYNQNWRNYSPKARIYALNRFPRGIQCFQCGEMIQMYRDDNAVRSTTNNSWIKLGINNFTKL